MPRQPPTRPTDRDEDDASDVSLSPADLKTQRWIDLVAHLLSRGGPRTFDQLAQHVPQYWHALRQVEAEPDARKRRTRHDSLKMVFERDKFDLKRLGVPLESLPDEAGNDAGAYRLRMKDFYLPYLCFASGRGAVPALPPRPAPYGYGYGALGTLTFEADELQAVVDAAARVRSLGEPLLAADAASALRKLAVDLPLDSAAPRAGEPRVVLPRARPDAKVFEVVSDALQRRKRVAFDYHAMSSDTTEWRETEPYGLFFLGGHWYLAARDVGRDGLRNFRLNRMSRVAANDRQPKSADFVVPEDFDLAAHAASRQAWELGDSEPVTAIVEFRGQSGPAVAAARLGAPVEGATAGEVRRAFRVRRQDSFVRWLLSFAGEVVPLEPPEVVAAFVREARRVAALYAAEPSAAEPARPLPAPKAGRDAWKPATAAEQFRRLLHIIPQLADGQSHRVAEVARRAGTDAETLQRDIYTLTVRYDAPPGFVGGDGVYLTGQDVRTVWDHFLRPMRLTASELCALELGLAMLRDERTPAEHAPLDGARRRLREAIVRLGDEDPIPDGLHAATLGQQWGTTHLAVARDALESRRKLRLVYRKSGASESETRVVCPYALVSAQSMMYLVAHCEHGEGIRVFRMDRVEDAAVVEGEGETFTVPDGFSVDDVVRDDAVFVAPHAGVLRVRYSARVARWIAEREGRAVAGDGSITIDRPLADAEWGMRHALQYGGEAEVIAPVELRERLRERMGGVAASIG